MCLNRFLPVENFDDLRCNNCKYGENIVVIHLLSITISPSSPVRSRGFLRTVFHWLNTIFHFVQHSKQIKHLIETLVFNVFTLCVHHEWKWMYSRCLCNWSAFIFSYQKITTIFFNALYSKFNPFFIHWT